MVTPTASTPSEPLNFPLSSERTLPSFSGFFQTGKYSVADLNSSMTPFFVLMNAAFVLAPPMSKPSTFTNVGCLQLTCPAGFSLLHQVPTLPLPACYDENTATRKQINLLKWETGEKPPHQHCMFASKLQSWVS